MGVARAWHVAPAGGIGLAVPGIDWERRCWRCLRWLRRPREESVHAKLRRERPEVAFCRRLCDWLGSLRSCRYRPPQPQARGAGHARPGALAAEPHGVAIGRPPDSREVGQGDQGAKEKPSGRKKSASDNPERIKEPTTFTEAFERGKQSLDEAQAAIVGMQIAKNQEDVDPAVLTQLAEDKQQNEQAAMADFRLALALAGKGSAKDRPDAEQLNTARYLFVFSLLRSGPVLRCGGAGRLFGPPRRRQGRRRRTTRPRGAEIVLASYIKLYRDSKQADKSFETKKIRETAEYILAQWPTEAEAEDAALSLLNFAITDRRLDDALGYLNRIPADSPRRGQSDLYAGQALWAAYLKAVQTPADERPPQEELDRFKTQARQLLHDGVERIESKEPSPMRRSPPPCSRWRKSIST